MEKLICPKCKSDDVTSNPNFSGYSVNTCNYCGKDWVSKNETKTTDYTNESDLNNNYPGDRFDEDNKEDDYDYYEYITRPCYKWLVVYTNGDTDTIIARSISEVVQSYELRYSEFYITNIIRL